MEGLSLAFDDDDGWNLYFACSASYCTFCFGGSSVENFLLHEKGGVKQ